MKKVFYISALALMTACAFSSCEDFIEAENKSAGGQTAEEYFKTEAGLEGFRAYAYYSLKQMSTWTDIYEDGTDLYCPSRGKTPTSFQYYSLTPEDGDVKDLYIACYQLVNNANGLIYYGGDKYAHEAKFLRAYGYYMLTQHFGDVPYSDRYINDANREYPRVPVKTIYDNCIEDLQPLVDDANIPQITTDGTINRRAIAALLAKICLAAGWDLETTLDDAEKGTYTKANTNAYFTMAATYAEKAINGIALTQSFEEKWSAANEANNPETFFAVQYERAGYPGDATSGGHGLQNDFGSYYGAQDANGLKVSSSVKVPTVKSLHLWGEGDERYQGTFMTEFVNYDGKEWPGTGYYAFYNNADYKTLPLALYYAPYYVTKADFEAYLQANQARFVMGDYRNTPHAYLMQNPVLKYDFNADGSVSTTTTLAYNDATLAAQLNFTPCVRKYDDPETPLAAGNTSNGYRDVVLLHASDLYLVAAEAYYMSGNEEEAWNKINAVRTRAKAADLNNTLANYDPDYPQTDDLTMLDLILDERARELYAENQRWMDLRRTRQLVRYNIQFNTLVGSVSDMSNPIGEIKWYRPIPTDELNSNTALDIEDQNPGY